ncbi:MAG: class I SAM-dependent methyltransferase [Bdellovibrionales bacterium]
MGAPASTLSFQQLVQIVRILGVPKELTPVAGWLTPNEQQALYALAYILEGPFLEIGSWVGKSTSIISRAIRESGQRKRFVTSELNPTLANYKPYKDGMGFFLPADSDVCLGFVTMESWEKEMKPVIAGSGGVVGALTANLKSLDLLDLVDIHVGNFSGVPKLDYHFIFSDAMHSPDEIREALPALREIIGGRSVILAAHDWTADNERFLRGAFPIVDAVRYDSLFVCQIDQEKVG